MSAKRPLTSRCTGDRRSSRSMGFTVRFRARNGPRPRITFTIRELLGGRELRLHGFRQRERARQWAHHDHEFVDRTVLVGVQEVAALYLPVADSCLEDEGVIARAWRA